MIKKLLALFVMLSALAGGGVWWVQTRLTAPFQGFSEEEVFVALPPGATVVGIADRLVEAGVVRDAWTFRLAARVSGQERRLQAGEYRFAAPATPYAVVDRLARGDVYVMPITFREGLTIVEMADVFEASGLGSAAEFVAAAGRAELIHDVDPGADNLEGYLFPSTYRVPRQMSADGLVELMVSEFRRVFAGLRGEAEARGLDARELVTLASVVERETGAEVERPLVAAVFHNRLRIGMPLQTDPTVIYAMMQSGRWNGNITRRDLAMDHPYNTYRHRGLPPGPIAAPGRAALEAVVRPAEVPYLYFVSRNDGTHVFSSTLAEHNRAVNQWQRR